MDNASSIEARMNALKISIGMSNELLEQLQNDILDLIFTYLPVP